MMDDRLTELVFILDASGSMHGLEEDTIGGFNSMIDRQKGEEGRALVSTVVFSDTSRVIHDRADLLSVPAMTQRDYTTDGSTALYDAVGGAVRHIGNIHKYARPEDIPGRTTFVITTDGMENASRRFTARRVREMIERQRTKYGWEFVFLGANIDAADAAADIGIDAKDAVDFCCDAAGIRANFALADEVILASRQRRPRAQNWRAQVDAHLASRRNRA